MKMNTKLATPLGSEPDPSQKSAQFVVFALNDQRYCVDIQMVREIRMVRSITALPGAGEHYRGIINLRGTIVPVFDLRQRFGLGQTEIIPGHQQTLVIASIDQHLTGLLTDEVLDILTLPADAVAPMPNATGGTLNPFFKGLVSTEESMMIVIDLNLAVPTLNANEPEWDANQHARGAAAATPTAA